MALKGCNSLRACFRHLGTSMEQENFLTSSIAFFKNIKFNHLYNFRYFFVFSFNQQQQKLKVRSDFLVRKQGNKSHVFSVLFFINLNLNKVLFFQFSKWVNNHHLLASREQRSDLVLQGFKLIFWAKFQNSPYFNLLDLPDFLMRR